MPFKYNLKIYHWDNSRNRRRIVKMERIWRKVPNGNRMSTKATVDNNTNEVDPESPKVRYS